MIEELLQQDCELQRAKINSETAKIPWHELQRFFAAGKVMRLAPDVDLVDAAYAMQQDDTESVAAWAEAGQLGPVADDQARDWFERDVSLWAVVVKPWVLVQEIEAG